MAKNHRRKVINHSMERKNIILQDGYKQTFNLSSNLRERGLEDDKLVKNRIPSQRLRMR